MYTIAKLAKEFGLSRSTLLYYDKIGLLKPERRSETKYRLYSSIQVKRLEQIHTLREAGLSLEQINTFLDSETSKTAGILHARLCAINKEIARLREQQQLIIALLGQPELTKETRVLTKKMWVTILESAGLDAAGRNAWHQHFEHTAPEAHQDFLESLGLEKEEIAEIREYS